MASPARDERGDVEKQPQQLDLAESSAPSYAKDEDPNRQMTAGLELPPGAPAAAPTGLPEVAAAHRFAEGGARGWTAVLGCACVMFITWGYLNAFGVYEAYYLQTFLRSYSPSSVAWIGSLQVCFQFSGSLISGPISDRLGPMTVIWPASMTLALSVLLTSLCTEYYQFILCQGLLGGLSNGLVTAPAVAVVGHYFNRKRPMAIGIAAAGSALGGILFPIMINRMLHNTSLGFGWTQRIIGFVVLFFALGACITIRPGLPPRKGQYLLPHAFKDPAFSLQVTGVFFACLGLFTPFFYLPSYAEAHGMDANLAWYLITMLNAGSFFGRLTGGILSVKFGAFNMLSVCSAVCGLLIFCWLRMTSTAALCIMAVLYGFFSGGVISLMLATLAHIAPNPNQIGTYIGMASGIFAIAGLTGTPISGALVAHYGSFTQAIIFSGVVTLVGSGFVLLSRYALAKRSGNLV